MAARSRADGAAERAYLAYSTILDRAAFEEWRQQHGYDFFELPVGQPAEAVDLGLEEAFGPDRITVVEWPERLPGLLPDGAIRIRIEGAGDEPRRLQIER